jgi:hypothetical protein
MESTTIHLNYDPSKIHEDFDLETSEGKHLVSEMIAYAFSALLKSGGDFDPQVVGVLQAFSSEG